MALGYELCLAFPQVYASRLYRLSDVTQLSFRDLFLTSLEVYAALRAGILKGGTPMVTQEGNSQRFTLQPWLLRGGWEGWSVESVVEGDELLSVELPARIHQEFMRLIDNAESDPIYVVGAAFGAYEQGTKIAQKNGSLWIDYSGEGHDPALVHRR